MSESAVKGVRGGNSSRRSGRTHWTLPSRRRLSDPAVRSEVLRPDCRAASPVDAGTMSQPVNYYLLRPKHSGDLAWIWLKLNAAQLVSKYLTATARGMGHQRVHVDELLRMPIERP